MGRYCPAGTLKVVVNEMLDKGEPLPDGLTFDPYTKAVIVPVTKTKRIIK